MKVTAWYRLTNSSPVEWGYNHIAPRTRIACSAPIPCNNDQAKLWKGHIWKGVPADIKRVNGVGVVSESI